MIYDFHSLIGDHDIFKGGFDTVFPVRATHKRVFHTDGMQEVRKVMIVKSDILRLDALEE